MAQDPSPPDTQLRVAFTAMHWVGWTFEAAMADPLRRGILAHKASHCHRRAMETIVFVSRIELLASRAAGYAKSAADANPYPPQSAAWRLFAKCFDAELKRRQTLTQPAQAAIKNVVTKKDKRT